MNAVARVFPAWDFQMLSYGRVAGMLAFAMQESRLFAAAQEAAATALDMDPTDVWACTRQCAAQLAACALGAHARNAAGIGSAHPPPARRLNQCMQWHTSTRRTASTKRALT